MSMSTSSTSPRSEALFYDLNVAEAAQAFASLRLDGQVREADVLGAVPVDHSQEIAKRVFSSFIYPSLSSTRFNYLIRFSIFDEEQQNMAFEAHGWDRSTFEKIKFELLSHLIYEKYEGYIETKDKEKVEKAFPQLGFIWTVRSDAPSWTHYKVTNLQGRMEPLLKRMQSTSDFNTKLNLFLGLKQFQREFPRIELPMESEILNALKPGLKLNVIPEYKEHFISLMENSGKKVIEIGWDEAESVFIFMIDLST